MAEMKRRAALIGDIIGSRDSRDRSALHEALVAVLDEVNAAVEPEVQLHITAGDEYQGVFASVGQGLHAALLLRLRLLPLSDLRHGIGWGELTVLQDEPRVEDGPAWWAARAAIEAAESQAQQPGTRAVRTWYERAEQTEGPEPGPINAALLCRDQIVSDGDDRSRRMLRGLLEGRTQTEIAEREGISASAVSQRVRSGLATVLAAQELLQEVR